MAAGHSGATVGAFCERPRASRRCFAKPPRKEVFAMPRAIDFHVHLPIAEFMDGAIGTFRKAAEQYFHAEVKLRDIEEIAAYYAEQDMVGVLLAWDAETATGRKPLRNDTVAEIVRRFPQQFVGFASVDPHKGDRAITEIERAVRDLGLSGAKFHPGVQAFYPSDRRSTRSSRRSRL